MASKKSSAMVIVLLSFFLIFVAGVVIGLIIPIEGFFGAQGGEMVQLASSHVPTMEDAEEEREEAKQVQREIVDMTGYW
jgi:hypothetical protein